MDAVIADFMADQQLAGRSARTVKEHRNELLRLKRWLDAESLDWQQVTHKQLKRYVRLKAHMAFGTRSNMLCTLRVFYSWAVEEEYCTSSPAAGFKTPSRPHPVPRSLRASDVASLLEHLAAQEGRTARRDEALILTGVYEGLRAAELAALCWSAIDWKERSITIRISKMARGRTLPIHPALLEVLERWRELQGFSDSAAVFAVDKEQPLQANQIGRTARRIAKESGIHFTTHMLRHTFATTLLRRCKNLYTVSKALGHAQIAQTMIYLSADIEDLRDDMGKMPGLEGW